MIFRNHPIRKTSRTPSSTWIFACFHAELTSLPFAFLSWLVSRVKHCDVVFVDDDAARVKYALAWPTREEAFSLDCLIGSRHVPMSETRVVSWKKWEFQRTRRACFDSTFQRFYGGKKKKKEKETRNSEHVSAGNLDLFVRTWYAPPRRWIDCVDGCVTRFWCGYVRIIGRCNRILGCALGVELSATVTSTRRHSQTIAEGMWKM